MVLRCMPNSGHGGPPGTRVMTIFVFYVNPQIRNIEKFEVYGVYKSREVSHQISHQISHKFPFECHRSHVWRPIFDASYDHNYKSVHFVKVELGDTHG